jgi:hypothetical protein
MMGPLDLEPVVIQDPIFQRIMVAVMVNPKKVAGVNADGARAFQDFLIAPATQAWIRAFRYPGFDQQTWWPAATTARMSRFASRSLRLPVLWLHELLGGAEKAEPST